jgi:SAM-dependent methyltransferase
LFDVSSMYLPFWERFTNAEKWCTHELKPEWQSSFDAVMSYYVMEHVVEPVAVLRQMASLLKPAGVLYWLVPNVVANPADFIVADHVNHFSEPSIEEAIQRAGLHLIEIDGHSHEAGWIVTASKNVVADQSDAEPIHGLRGDSLQQQIAEMANYWTEIEQRIRAFETEQSKQGAAAIYGSGFYGTFVASRIADINRVQCFVDQSPFRQGKTLLNKPIIAPEQLSNDIRTIYVGLNMRSARKAISEIDSWRDRRHTYLFL